MKAYEAYQQAVYRDGRNAFLWCSVGILYFTINQYADALDAYSRSIRLNPYIAGVWYNVGVLHEASNHQLGNAIDAYDRASSLSPNDPVSKARLILLKDIQARGGDIPVAPSPVELHHSPFTRAQGGAVPLDLKPSGGKQSSDIKGLVKLAPVGTTEFDGDVRDAESLSEDGTPSSGDESVPSTGNPAGENIIRTYRSTEVQTEPWYCNCSKGHGENVSENKSD